MKLLIATTNRGKLGEVRSLLAGAPFELVTLEDVGAAAPEETGTTFAENAALKANAGARHARLWTLGDDSGLCVDALDGRPGLASARYDTTEERRREKLLRELADVPAERRDAHFFCALSLVAPDGKSWATTGRCDGKIAFAARGTQGFGYDPLFELPDGRTLAELSADDKNRISHRGRAFAEMVRAMLQIPELTGRSAAW